MMHLLARPDPKAFQALGLELIGNDQATAGKSAALKQIEDAETDELAAARDAAKKGPKPAF